MADPKSAPVDEFFQKVKDNTLLEDLDFSPDYVREFDVINKFSRVFAHLIAKGPTGAKRLVCNAASQLEVVTAGESYDDYYFNLHTNITSDTEVVFSNIVKKIMIECTQGDGQVKFSKDGVSYGAWIRIGLNGGVDLELNTKSYIVNRYSGAGAYFTSLALY